jgi:hypothetical protein
LTNNTLTNFTQITVNLPEATKTMRKAWVEISCDDIITATGGTVTTQTINLRLGAAAYTSTTNSNTLANSGENIAWFFTRDFSSHFITNWTGTSMTCDVQLQLNQSTGTTLGMVNVTCVLYITYEYEDTAATHVKTVLIPLNAPVTSLPTTKTSHDTIPVLDTYLPEASKVYRSIFIVTQSNRNHSAATDHTVSYELSSLGVQVTGNYESALASDVWTRYVWNITSYITTNVTHTFNVWSSLAARNHSMQAWLVVTYEFDVASTTTVMNSLQLPLSIDSPMGGTGSSDFQRSDREFWVQETNPVRQRLAFYMFWQATSNEAGLNARIGTGSFVAYTNTGSGLICGNKGLMIRNDNPTGNTFARGRNKLSVDVYNTSLTQRGGNVGGFFILNYTSDKYSLGISAHNKTVIWPIFTQPTGAPTQQFITSQTAPNIPEAAYFITALGFHVSALLGTGGSTSQGFSLKIERLVAEGGFSLEPGYVDVSQHDGELGAYNFWAQVRTLFNRWLGDMDTSRLPIETNRKYIMNSANAGFMPMHLNMMITYHSITARYDGIISGSAGGTVTISLHRDATGEKVLQTTRTGNGGYGFLWYDDTEQMYVLATETNTLRDMSKSGLPAADYDIDIATPGGGGGGLTTFGYGSS